MRLVWAHERDGQLSNETAARLLHSGIREQKQKSLVRFLAELCSMSWKNNDWRLPREPDWFCNYGGLIILSTVGAIIASFGVYIWLHSTA